MTGQKVFEQAVNGDRVDINMESLPQGVYITNVRTKEGNEIVKVVKQ